MPGRTHVVMSKISREISVLSEDIMAKFPDAFGEQKVGVRQRFSSRWMPKGRPFGSLPT